MELRRTLALGASALVLVACGESHTPEEDAAIVFDASFPDTGTDSGPPPSNVGAACESDADCSGPADSCLTEGSSGIPGGYCTAYCSSDADCPSGSGCVPVGGGTSICFALCDGTNPDDQCPPRLGCTSLGGPASPQVCLPGCENDAECGDGLECVAGGGSLGAGICIDPDASLGGACTSDADCPTSAECLASLDFPGGTCVLAGCDATINTGCPDDAECIPAGFGGGTCFDACTADSDCRDGWECAPSTAAPDRSICQPIFDPDNLGQVCSAGRGSCQGGDCLTETTYGFPDSYCADFGCDPTATDPGCPGDGVCLATSGGGGICLDGCSEDTDCRTAYRCRPLDFDDPSSPRACLPGCTMDSHCTAMTGGGTRYVCNPGTGYCARPFDPDELGEPCAGGFRECRGGLCLTEDASGWPAGICAYAGCRLSGTGPSATCPSGSVCIDDGAGDPELGICVDGCTVGTTSCRPGYACVALADGGTEGACRPACTASDCGAGNTCNTETGLCE